MSQFLYYKKHYGVEEGNEQGGGGGSGGIRRKEWEKIVDHMKDIPWDH